MAKKDANLKVDFSNTDENGSRLPAGEYIVKITKAEVKKGEKAQYINWTLEVISGEFKGKKVFHNTTLAPHALFSLRNLLTAIGVKVPKGSLSLKLKEYIGKILGIYVEDGEYVNGKGKKQKKTEVVEMYEVEKQGKKWVKVVDDEDEEDEDEDDSDDNDEDEDEDSDDDDDDSDDDEDESDDEDEDEDEEDDSEDDDSDDEDDEDEDSDEDDDDEDDEEIEEDDDDLDEEIEEIVKGAKGKGKAGKAAPKEEPKKGKGKAAKEEKAAPAAKGKGKGKK